MRGERAFSKNVVPLLALGVGALAFAGCGDGAKGDCPALPACSGSPVGTWSVIDDSCQFQPVRPAQPVDVTTFGNISPAAAMITPPQPNPVVASQTTSGDWCSSLVYVPENPDAVLNVALWHDAPLLITANLTFGADNSYLSTLTFSTAGFPAARNTTHFAPHCLLANGAPAPTCDKLTAALTKFYAQVAVPSANPNFSNINCTGDALTAGCDCTYVYSVTVGDQGTWAEQGYTLLQDSTSYSYNGAQLPAQTPQTTIQTSLCAESGGKPTLQMTGANGGSLFGVLGLRTLELSQ